MAHSHYISLTPYSILHYSSIIIMSFNMMNGNLSDYMSLYYVLTIVSNHDILVLTLFIILLLFGFILLTLWCLCHVFFIFFFIHPSKTTSCFLPTFAHKCNFRTGL